MLEDESTLRTWALLEPPDASTAQPAELLADHRLEYLTYEGPVSGGRGDVTRWDEGTFEHLGPPTPESVNVMLSGRRLRGVARIRRDAGSWRYVFEARR